MDAVPISLPAVVDIRDWPELKHQLGLRVVRGHWRLGERLPTLEVAVVARERQPGDEGVPGAGDDPSLA